MLERELEGLPEELVRAQKLIDDAKVVEAIQLLKAFRESGDRSFREIMTSRFLESEALSHQGWPYYKTFKCLDQIYNEALDSVESYFSIDALLRKAYILTWNPSDETMKEAKELIIKAENLLERVPNKSTIDYKIRQARFFFVKGLIIVDSDGDIDQGIEHLKKSLIMREEHGLKIEICQSLGELACELAFLKGKMILAVDYIEQAISIAREMNKKYYLYISLWFGATIYCLKGEIDHSIGLFKEGLSILKDYNNKSWLALILNNLSNVYMMSGQLEEAFVNIKQSIEINNELGIRHSLANNYDYLIQILIQMGDFDQAFEELSNLEMIIKDLNDTKIDQKYRFNKAIVMKTSSRVLNRGKAEGILRKLLEEDLHHEIETGALLNLCELLLLELYSTNDNEVLEELKFYINRLVEVAEQSQSFMVLGESYLLRANLALISFDLLEGRRLLKEGQKIAETYGLMYLAVKISNEHDNLLKKLDDWKHLKEKQGSISERLDLARVRDQLELMATKRVAKPTPTIDEDPIVILIMTEGGTPIFSHSFTKDWEFADHLFSGFLTAVNSFSGEMLSEEFDRAKFGKYTLLMQPNPPFITSYLFKGQSFKAQKRIQRFVKKIQEKHVIWEKFNQCQDTNQFCRIEDIPSLGPLITKLFIEKSIQL